MSIYLLSPQPKELLVTMMIPSATLYTKVSSFAITSGEQDLKTLFLLVTLYYCGLREQNLVFNPTGYWWLLVVYTRTIINSVVSLPTGLKLESILHSSGWWMMTDFSKQVLWYTALWLELCFGEHDWVVVLFKGDYSVFTVPIYASVF